MMGSKGMQQGFHLKPKDFLRLWLCMVPQHCMAVGSTNTVGDPPANEALLVGGSRLSDDEAGGRSSPSLVPKGFIAVYVGPEQRRFVIPMTCLSMPEFVVLMDKVAEEVGFETDRGLHFPCEEEDFKEILMRCLRMHKMIVKGKRKRRSSSKVWNH